MSFGVGSSGFTQKTVRDILGEIEASERAAFGVGVNTLSPSVLGQINGLVAGRLAELWEVLGAIYRSLYPDSASGEPLDNVAAITGAARLASAKSRAESVACGGTSGTLLSTGRVLSVTTSGARFDSIANATLVAVPAWLALTPYAKWDFAKNGGRVYVALAAGTSGNAGGPTGTDVEADGSVTWKHVCTGDGAVITEFDSEQTGPINATTFTLKNIETPVSGWAAAFNLLDAVPGRDIETDAAFRVRRRLLLRAQGKATLEAVRARLLETANVRQALIFENPTDATDGDGIPPHAFEAVTEGGTNVAVAQSLFDNKPLGIQAYGIDIDETIVDSQGFSHEIKASRPADVPMFVDITVLTDPATFPADGAAQIQAAIVALGDTLQIGDDVIRVRFEAYVIDHVSGIVDVTVFKVDDNDPPVATGNFVTSTRQLATFDTANIDVTVT